MDGQFPINSLVWAKLSGYPWWPGYIKAKVGSEEYEVEYFGDFSRNYLHNSKIKPFGGSLSLRDRKNQSLAASFDMALQVWGGELTIEELKASVGHAPCEDPFDQVEKSLVDPSNRSLEPLEDPLVLKQNKSTPIFNSKRECRVKKTRAPVHVPKINEEIFFENSDRASEGSAREKKIKKGAKRGRGRPPSQQSVFAKSQSLAPGSEVKVPRDLAEDEVDSGVDEDAMSQLGSQFERIKSIEEQVRCLMGLIGRGREALDQAQVTLNSVREMILLEEKSMHLMYKTDIGANLVAIQEQVTEFEKEDRRFKEINDMLVAVMKLIRRKLFVEFFKTPEFDQKVIYSSSEMENIINLQRPAASGNKYFLTKDLIKRATAPTGHHEAARTVRDLPEDEQKTKRVVKKLAKHIYGHGKTLKLKSRDCEELATRIERETRNQSHTTQEYDHNILEVDRRLREGLQTLVRDLLEKGGHSKSKLAAIYGYLTQK